MIRTIAKKEIITAWRNRTLRLLYIIALVLMAVAVAGEYASYRRQREERQLAEQEKRQQWLNQDPKHPHIAAHFGNFAYMSKSGLSLFDPGLDAFTGTVVYLEPHRQNDLSFKPAEEQDASLRFGQLSLALIFQVLFPLLIIFMGYLQFTREKEQHTMALVYSQGLSFQKWYAGKLLAMLILIAVLFLPAMVLVYGASLWSGSLIQSLLPASLLFLLYAVYLGIWAAVTLLVSAYSHSSKGALLLLLCGWTLLVVLMPKWAANVGDTLHPLPSKYEFRDAITRDINQGINGHDPRGARALALEKDALARYHVDTVSRLPFNFEGYVMQAGEAYSSMVYDKHFGRLQRTLRQQNDISLWCCLANPYMSIQQLSMALAGTDYYTHLDFQQQAEAYRRQFVQQMNGDMMLHSKAGDWGYAAGRHVFEQVRPFRYHTASVTASLKPYVLSLVSLMTWSLVVLLLVIARKSSL